MSQAEGGWSFICHTSVISAESEIISVSTKKKEAFVYVPLEADANESLSKTSCAYSYKM